ncbi:MAG: coenzyme F420-reducing hydrogenase alpha subunit [Cyclobacteriaceae bacterium]|jgi:coenzyme F420-reducing hydrogenase alpha subunit
MKKLMIVISLVGFTTLGFAQGQRQQRPEPPSPKEMIKRATKELSLTKTQVEKWTEIHEKYESSIKEIEKTHTNMQKMGKELEAILTEEQSEKFKKMRENHGPARRNK